MIERLLKAAAKISISDNEMMKKYWEKDLEAKEILINSSDEMMKTHCDGDSELRQIIVDSRIKSLRNLEPLLAEYNNFELADAEMDELTLLLIEELLKEVENLRETTELFEEWVRDCPI